MREQTDDDDDDDDDDERFMLAYQCLSSSKWIVQRCAYG